MITIQRILCPVDLSETSFRALQHAAALAGWYESALTALYVEHTVPTAAGWDFEEFAIAPTGVIEAARTSRSVQAVGSFVRRARCATPVDVMTGESTNIDTAIFDAARALPADLIVMGTHGRTGVSRLFLGSVAERVLRGAPCPVMIVPPNDAVPTSAVTFKHIVCAIDFSESSLSGLEWALSLAEEADAHLSLLHVIEVPPELRVSTVVTYENIDELHAAVRADLLARLRDLIPRSATSFCSVETATAAGAAGHAILAFAREHHADLIVMGAQGHRALERWLFGSKTRDVVAGSTCPVLTVRR